MTILVVGISHQSTPLAIREKVSFQEAHQQSILRQLASYPRITEAVILSTCNRTEIYTNSDSIDPIITTLLAHSSISMEELEAGLYVHKDLAAVEHIMKVACGLDSMVLGEQQILGQMKAAVNVAALAGTIQNQFQYLFRRVFTLAKDVRSTTQIGACPVSIASIAVKLAADYFKQSEPPSVLLIGSGDTIRLVAKYLSAHQIRRITVASRQIENAAHLASTIEGAAIALSDINESLQQVDLVMSATASELPILGKGRIESCMAKRDRPLFLIDMAVPRDIEPEVATIPGVKLYTIDDLKELAQKNVSSRQHAAQQAEHLIKEHAASYVQWLNGLESTDMIRAFRQHIESIRNNEREKAHKQLALGADPKEVIDMLANSLANKLMHHPSVQMREACEYGRRDILRTVQEIFSINVTNAHED